MTRTSTRPGSLTLLAVLDFIQAGFGLLGILGQAAMLAARQDAVAGAHPMHLPAWLLAGHALEIALLITAGVGLLRLSVRWGRWMSTAAALLSLVLVVAGQWLMPAHLGDDAPMRLVGIAMSALYPMLVLIWVNGVVRDVWHPLGLRAPTGMAKPSSPWRLTVAQALRQSLRGASGPGFILGLVMTGLLTCTGVLLAGRVTEDLGKDTGLAPTAERRIDLLERGSGAILGFILRERTDASAGAAPPLSRRWASFLVREHPAGLSFTWLILAFLLPVAVVFTSAGQIARDAGNRGFRFLLTRIDRDTIYLGRFSAAAILAVGVVLLTVAACGVVMGLSEAQADWAGIAAWTLHAAVALSLASLPFVALGMLASTLISHGFAALTVVQGVVLVWPLVAISLGKVWAPLVHTMHALPLLVQFGMFHPSRWVELSAALLCCLYAVVYLWLGLRHFRRRDL